MADFDLIIRNGTIVDGSGGPTFTGDVAIKGDRIAAVGKVEGSAREELDAAGRIVTPGFVDIHTHYDGQVSWEQTLAPSSNHGVTTIVGGNCGVGFAPCRQADHEALVSVMEGVEDIPEAVMAAGVPWTWESFPEYLETLAARAYDIDIAMQVPHSPVRVYVMGERGVNREDSTAEDRAAMTAIVREAVEAGAIGVSTSRSWAHRAKTGELAPSVHSAEAEVLALAEGLREAGAGVFQLVPEFADDPFGELRLVERIAEHGGRPVSFTLMEIPSRPESWRATLAFLDRINHAGHQVRGQVPSRPVGFHMGLELSLNPITTRPSYMAIADRPLAERVAILRDPAFKAKVLAEEPVQHPQALFNMACANIDSVAELGDPPNYFPALEDMFGARAEREGTTTLSLAYDLMLERDGRNILYLPSANYATRTPLPIHGMITHAHTAIGLGDGGAHYGFICDAGYTSHLLAYWARDAAEDHRVGLEWAVYALTRRTAETVGLTDRGLIAPGLKADLNIIDFDRLQIHAPTVEHDLPAGGRRMWQGVEGYDATIVSGVVTRRKGLATGALPGRLVRGPGHQPRSTATPALAAAE
jgi:N-acyl-D-aspartate/D-glutamate deacylase